MPERKDLDTIITMNGTPVRFEKNKEWIYKALTAEQSKTLNPGEHVEPWTALYASIGIILLLCVIGGIGKQRGIPTTESWLNKDLKDKGGLN